MPTGWFVFWCSRFIPHPKSPSTASESRTTISVLPESISVLPATISVLPAAVVRYTGPDLTANRIHRSTGFRLICSPPNLHFTPRHTLFRPIYPPTSSHPVHFPTALPDIRTIVL